MNKKTKNKIEVKWPKGLYTIAQLQTLNPSIVNITLRYKINQLIAEGKTVSIGKNVTTMGRPTLVFAPAPVSIEMLDLAKNKGIVLDEKYNKLTTVASTEVANYNTKNDITISPKVITPRTESKTHEVVSVS